VTAAINTSKAAINAATWVKEAQQKQEADNYRQPADRPFQFL